MYLSGSGTGDPEINSVRVRVLGNSGYPASLINLKVGIMEMGRPLP